MMAKINHYDFLLYSSDSETSLYEIDGNFGEFADSTEYYKHIVKQLKSKLPCAPLDYLAGLARTNYRHMKKKNPTEMFPSTGSIAIAAGREIKKRRARAAASSKPFGSERLAAYRRREAERKPQL